MPTAELEDILVTLEFQLLRRELDYIRIRHMGEKLPSVHILGDFSFKDTGWPEDLANRVQREVSRKHRYWLTLWMVMA